jgi:putative ABC transport system permease protein
MVALADIAIKNLLHNRFRFVVTLLGVTVSVVLMFAQVGIYLGFMHNASIIIDNTAADIWITSKNSANFDFPMPFSEAKLNRVKEVPGVAWAEHLVLGWANMRLTNGASENIELIGFNPHTGVGGPWRLREGSIEALKAGGGIIVDESAFSKLGRLRIGDSVEILDSKVKVVGICEGIRGFTTAPYVFTAYRTAQDIIPWLRERTVFIVAGVVPGADVLRIVTELRKISNIDVYTRGQYSLKTRLYWTWETGIGVGFGLTALLALVVGMVIVGQTIYAATIEHLREFGTLKAIGATNREIYGIIVEQALVNAVCGYGLALVAWMFGRRFVSAVGPAVVLPTSLMVAIFVITIIMCLGASYLSVRRALQVDPVMVFRS